MLCAPCTNNIQDRLPICITPPIQSLLLVVIWANFSLRWICELEYILSKVDELECTVKSCILQSLYTR
jgi:hypothetical protein